MTNDDFFTVTTTWQKVEVESTEAQDGTFSLSNLGPNRIEIRKTDTAPPAQGPGTTFMKAGAAARKLNVAGAVRIWVRVKEGEASIGVIPA